MKKKSGDAKLNPGYSNSGSRGGAVDGVLIQRVEQVCVGLWDWYFAWMLLSVREDGNKDGRKIRAR